MSWNDLTTIYGPYEKGPVGANLEPGVPVKMDPTKLNELAKWHTEQLNETINKVIEIYKKTCIVTATNEDLDKIAESIGVPNKNCAIGYNALLSNSSGKDNVIIGTPSNIGFLESSMGLQEKGFDPAGITFKSNEGMQWHIGKLKSDIPYDTNYFLGNPEDMKAGIREDPLKKTIEFYVAGYTQQCFGYDVQLCHTLLAHYSNKLKYAWPFTKDSSPDEWWNNHSDIDNGINYTLKTKDEWRDRLYPLASMFTTSLVPEPDNSHDPNALQIWIKPKDEWNSHPDREDIWQRIFGEVLDAHSSIHNRDYQLRGLAGSQTIIPLGYVPAVIAPILKKNLDRLGVGVVKKIRQTTKKDGTVTYSTKVEFPYDCKDRNIFDPLDISEKPKTASQKRIELLEVD